MRLGDCYRPEFSYDANAPSANRILRAWLREFKYLPIATSQPQLLARMIQRHIWKQSERQGEHPQCSRHQIPMVLLGEPGLEWRASKCRGVKFWNPDSNNGKIVVSRGLFRCPHPGCYMVAAARENEPCGEILGARSKYPPCPRYRRAHVFPHGGRRCPCGFVR